MTRLTYLDLYSETTTDDGTSEFATALGELRAASPADTVPHYVNGDSLHDGPEVARFDPSHTSNQTGSCREASPGVVAAAIAAARDAFPAWAALGRQERAAVLRQAIPRVEEQRIELAALLSLETGKSRLEAVGEVDEVNELIRIYSDFCEEDFRFSTPLTAPSNAAASSRTRLRPFGVFGVIVPFNYPMALAVNMAVAALLAGNTVVVKPAELGPRSADAIARILLDVLPKGTLNVVHGGDATGRALVDGDIDGIAFTGSAEVGLGIIRKLQSGPYPRPVIAEMGGKNPTVVGASADLEAAAKAIVKSAFGLSGQKCSSCSRVLAVADVHDELCELIAAEAGSLRMGDPIDADVFAGPLVEEAAATRFDRSVASARDDGNVLVGGPIPADAEGYYAPATVVAELPQGHPLTREEQFMPFLTIGRFDSFEAAMEEANAVPYGLTGGIFSRDEGEIETFLDRAEAGCLFVNNSAGATTGVWPGYHTFGGWKASGNTGKHGFGAFYVQLFAREQCLTTPV